MYKNIGKDYHWKINIELAQTFDRIKNHIKSCDHIRYAI
jgi:hypothetical protein